MSEACQHCYAESLAKRYGHDVWGKGGERRFFGDKHWNEPVRWNRKAEEAGEPKLVFCASMADVFEDHAELPPQRERLWGLIARTPWLTWQLLTKRPENIASMVPDAWYAPGAWPVNVWVGTTVETQRWADERLDSLVGVPAPVRFVSCEPLFSDVDLLPWIADPNGVNWVIAGGESGGKARPSHPDWFRNLRDLCTNTGVPFLFKQWGEWAPAPWKVTRDREAEGATHGIRNDTGHYHELGHKPWSLERNDEAPVFYDGALVWAGVKRVGKKAAGWELDGRTWDAIPERRVGLVGTGDNRQRSPLVNGG